MVKATRQTGSFVAIDKAGRRHLLHVFTDIIDAGTFDNPNAELEGLKSIVTSQGDHVNRVESGKYQIVATGEVLTSTDSAAI